MSLMVRLQMLKHFLILVLLSFLISFSKGSAYGEVLAQQGVTIQGEMKKWHKVTLEITGPSSGEQGKPNPFLDYRLNVTFRKGGKQYVIPGYYAADGNAGETSANSGNIWKVHFTPDATGEWEYEISFRQGNGIAVSNASGSALPADGTKGSFSIGSSDKKLPDNRARGRLQYVGGHYLQYAETGEYFLKGGADAPENFLAYEDFDGTQNNDGIADDLIKTWAAHKQDWRSGDPTWQGSKGKGMIGALNYLASKGLNVFSFLALNILGDDKNVFPYIKYNGKISGDVVDDRVRFDVSKLDQWEVIFEHAETLGMFIHFKLQETEVDQLLDQGYLGVERKLYYREMIARFGHHLSMNWNLGEEHRLWAKNKLNDTTNEYLKQYGEYFYENDPYHNHLVVHTNTDKKEMIYPYLIGNQSKLTGFSLQSFYSDAHNDTKYWLAESVKAGKPWVTSNDEQGPSDAGVLPDGSNNNHDDIRTNVLWGHLMAGGTGSEFYFGYAHPQSDLTCEDWRSRDDFWDYVAHALKFFREYVPYWEMKSADELVGNSNSNSKYCFAKQGEAYVVFLAHGGSTDIDLSDGTGTYTVKWYNPRKGGSLMDGSVKKISGSGGTIGMPPSETDQDWVALLQRTGDVDLNINKFVLYDTESNSILADPLVDGAVIQANDKVSVVAVSSPAVVGSVKFAVDGSPTYISNDLPYAIAGHSGGGAEAGAFIMKNGVAIWEAESIEPQGDWKLEKDFKSYSGSGYYNWVGEDYFKSPGNGTLRYLVKVEKSGNYQFVFRTKNTEEINGEHNDSWVKIPSGKNVPGEEALNGDWVKVYQTQPRKWSWQAYTVDHENRPIRVKLEPGVHEILISGRSNGHGVDRIALFDYDAINFTDDKFDAMSNSEQVNGNLQMNAMLLAPGMHTITAIPFASANANGIKGNDLSVTINIVNGGNTNLPPSAPADLQATAKSPTQIDLTWQDIAIDEFGFKVERSDDGGDSFTTIANVGKNITSYSSKDLDSETTYYYRVKAYNDAGDSAPSNVASATTESIEDEEPVDLPPSQPTGLQAMAVSSNQINLTWNDNADDESGFKVERSDDGGNTFTSIANVGENTTSYSSQGLQGETTYHYRVKAYNAVGNSPSSNVASATTEPVDGGSEGPTDFPPAAPTGLQAVTVSSTQIDLTWNDNADNETGFKVKRSDDGGKSFTTIAKVDNNVSSYSSQNLESEKTYFYMIKAYNDAGNSSPSNVASATTETSNDNGGGGTNEGAENLFPVADASVIGTHGNENFGDRDVLVVRQTPGKDWSKESYLRFDLSDAKGIVQKAELVLQVVESSDPVEHVISFVSDDSWSEYGITWNNRPAPSSGYLSQTMVTSTGVVKFDVTATVQDQLGEQASFLVQALENVNPYIKYASKEHENVSYRPVLKITYTDEIPPAPNPSRPKVAKLVLYNAATNEVISDPIQDGAVINLDELGVEEISIVAVTEPQKVGSVKFVANGNRTVENAVPYAINGDEKGDFNAWDFSEGVNDIKVVPYTGKNKSGEKGKPYSISITITRGAALRLANNDTSKKGKGEEAQVATDLTGIDTMEEEHLTFSTAKENLFIEKKDWSVKVYPNPVSNVMFISVDESATYHLFGLQGILEKAGKVSGGQTEKIDVSSVPSGVYYLRITTGEKTSSQKIIIGR